MAIIRRTMENIRRMKPRINRAKIDATTEANIRRHMREDGQTEGDLAGFSPIIPPQVLRKRLRMTQAEFARAIRIPLCNVAQLGTRSRATGSGRPFIADHRGKKSKGRAQSSSGITIKNARRFRTGETHRSRRTRN